VSEGFAFYRYRRRRRRRRRRRQELIRLKYMTRCPTIYVPVSKN
jgi:hypothetical protein